VPFCAGNRVKIGALCRAKARQTIPRYAPSYSAFPTVRTTPQASLPPKLLFSQWRHFLCASRHGARAGVDQSRDAYGAGVLGEHPRIQSSSWTRQVRPSRWVCTSSSRRRTRCTKAGIPALSSTFKIACANRGGVRSTWLQLIETLGANNESQNKRRCDRVPLVGGNAVPQRYWMWSRSSQVLAERRDQISNGVTAEAGTSLCTQPNDNRFDRATHSERAVETRMSLTERVRRNYTGQSSKAFFFVL
jgi:hypothetical protein